MTFLPRPCPTCFPTFFPTLRAELRPWAPWIVNDQVGGYQVRYEKDFTFTTVKGAGHMCPSTQPERAHHMMMRFIRGVPL